MVVSSTLILALLLAPLLGSVIAGLLGRKMGPRGAHSVTILGVSFSFVVSLYLMYAQLVQNAPSLQFSAFTWAAVSNFQFSVSFLIDRLTVFMLVIVNFVSLLVHIYSIGYMKGDQGYTRFFSYLSAFTFSMMSLVMANNFLVLFFGWEAVGLVSYLLIGFWFERENANVASLKAFLVNRVGDLGFLLGLAAIFLYFGTLDYAPVFAQTPTLALQHPQVITGICLLLFLGAAGKSAQIPLHVWLEGSMEGPTPISALIHAATMVTAGVFMLARLSPLFEYSATALSTVLLIGASTALFMGILALVQQDIKRVVAFSTLSQLGYMMAAQGASAFSIGLFHLMTHASFKALLFLAAGSVIIGMHHEQNMQQMGGLRKKMPITYVCLLIGALALIAVPPFAGFYSKDLIIEAVGLSTLTGHSIAYTFLLIGTFVTALYTFRMVFLVFHGTPRSTAAEDAHEPDGSVLLPLIVLGLSTLFSGILFFKPALHHFFGSALFYSPNYNVLPQLALTSESVWQFTLKGFIHLPFWLGMAGVLVAWISYCQKPQLPHSLTQKFPLIYRALQSKYGIDAAYDQIFGQGTRQLGSFLWKFGDIFLIDKLLVEGLSQRTISLGRKLRALQSGYLYHYALSIILGLLLCLVFTLFVPKGIQQTSAVIPLIGLNEVQAQESEADTNNMQSMKKPNGEAQRKNHLKDGMGITTSTLSVTGG